MNHFAKNIQFLRTLRGIKQVNIEELISIKRSTWNNYEKSYSVPDIDRILDISNFFGVSLDDLISQDIENVYPIEHIEQLKNGVKSIPNCIPNCIPNDLESMVEEPQAVYERTPQISQKEQELKETIETQKMLITSLNTNVQLLQARIKELENR